MLSTTVVIPTFHRPAELTTALRSILTQTRRPDELIVVDDGNLPELPLHSQLQQAGIACRLERKALPGLTESRNLAIAIATGDLLFFFDDDVELFPDYLEHTICIFEQDAAGRIGGVGGVIVNHKPVDTSRRLRRILDRLFLNSGTTEGRVLRSGFSVNYGYTGRLPDTDYRVDFLPGGVCAYRREVFSTLRFTPGYHEVAIGEDLDFSYRVGRRWRLVLTPKSRLYHFESPKMRHAPFATGRRFILGKYLFFRDLVHGASWDWLLFWYACGGYLIIRLLILAASRQGADWDRVRGVVSAILDIARGRLPQRAVAVPP
ncbi:glycosyltransferase family 2 protein [uncultured Lamprocystis sp.]|jgi:GT2 family glycosyltransferase|uniref:glycosyltransferase family 2 protein n=1 Tax=uncultured Lamprocystis sp. TaxID=543132 RepID=UPI0025ED686F|nr:glycosyltransferase family 2 protein [uncultured Lamprocystis sp.]